MHNSKINLSCLLSFETKLFNSSFISMLTISSLTEKRVPLSLSDKNTLSFTHSLKRISLYFDF